MTDAMRSLSRIAGIALGYALHWASCTTQNAAILALVHVTCGALGAAPSAISPGEVANGWLLSAALAIVQLESRRRQAAATQDDAPGVRWPRAGASR